MIACLDGRLKLITPLFLLPLVLATGCAGATEDDPEGTPGSGESAQTAVPAYDAVIRNGTKVDTNDTPSARDSASTRLLGWIPRVAPGAGAKQLLTVARWADIRDPDGGQPFTQARVVSDTGTGASRKVIVKLTLDGGVDLDVKATTSEQNGAITIKLVNTSAYSHWFVGTILEPEKLVMEVKLVPYKDGVIVDATTRVKLARMEERAPKLTASITAIFAWLQRTTR